MHISEYVAEAHGLANRYRRATREQALTYACEDVAARHEPLRRMNAAQVTQFVGDVCIQEDVDVPRVLFGTGKRSCTAYADRSLHTIAISNRTATVDLVLHELSHLISRSDGHDADFRSTLVRLARTHAGVAYASLLRNLFVGTGLDPREWRP